MPTNGGRHRQANRPDSQRISTKEQRTDYNFLLIQQLQPQTPNTIGIGFAAYFLCEPTDNPRFSNNSIPVALAQIREAGELTIHTISPICAGITRTVYVIIPDEDKTQRLESFRSWMVSRSNSKTPTCFDDALKDPRSVATVAWWSLEDTIAWSLDIAIAIRLREAFKRS